MDRARDDPDLGPPGRRRARAVRADPPSACRSTAATTGTMSSAGMPSVMRITCTRSRRRPPRGSRRACPAAGTKMHDAFGAGPARPRPRRRRDTGTDPSSAIWPPLPGANARDDVCAIGLHRPGAELALAPRRRPARAAGLPARRGCSCRSALECARACANMALSAASSRLAAVSKCAASSRRAASAAFVPTIRTTIGTSRVCRCAPRSGPARPRRLGSSRRRCSRGSPRPWLAEDQASSRSRSFRPSRRCRCPGGSLARRPRAPPGPSWSSPGGAVDHAPDRAVEVDGADVVAPRLGVGRAPPRPDRAAPRGPGAGRAPSPRG